MSIEETYFSLLRSALWGDGCPPVQKEDVPVLSDIAIKQSTAPMIYDRLLACGAGISAEKAVRMKQFIAKNIMTHTSLNTLIAKVVKELRGMGIEGVLLKGQGNASHYRRPELRACGDIDYYVGEENFMEAAHYISRLAGEKEFNENGSPRSITTPISASLKSRYTGAARSSIPRNVTASTVAILPMDCIRTSSL